jgi:hypothetical protein
MNAELRRARFDREFAEAVKVAGDDITELQNFLDRWRELKGLDEHQLQRLKSLRRDFVLATGERPWMAPVQLSFGF